MNSADYERIEAMIASDASPVGIDAKKTHVMILGKLESIEQRLAALEDRRDGRFEGMALPSGMAETLGDALGGAVDVFDESVACLAARGVAVDRRLRALMPLLETLTSETTISMLERLAMTAALVPDVVAGATDAFDEAIEQAGAKGIDVDCALRNGVVALLYLGQRISAAELESLGDFLRSDMLRPRVIEIVGKLGRALMAAAEAPRGSVGPLGAVARLSQDDTKRSTAFLLEFVKQFGVTLDGASQRSGPLHDGESRS